MQYNNIFLQYFYIIDNYYMPTLNDQKYELHVSER